MEMTKIAETPGLVGYSVQDGDAKATIVVADTEVLIDWLWVRPEARKHGIGRALLLKLRATIGKPVRPVTVVADAVPFWKKMQAEAVAGEPDFVYA